MIVFLASPLLPSAVSHSVLLCPKETWGDSLEDDNVYLHVLLIAFN